jgi:hypothetical protein
MRHICKHCGDRSVIPVTDGFACISCATFDSPLPRFLPEEVEKIVDSNIVFVRKDKVTYGIKNPDRFGFPRDRSQGAKESLREALRSHLVSQFA